MAENKKEQLQEGSVAQPQAAPQPESRPNRDRYAGMFAEDNPDINFDDKEARYGRMAEERESYRNLSKAGKGLSQALDKNRWLGAMFQDLAENPDKDPISWMYDNGIDVQKAMENEEYRMKVAEGLAEFQQNQAEGEAAAEQKAANFESSCDELSALQEEAGLSDEQCSRMWNHLFDEVVGPAMDGKVSKETWKMVLHAMNYDQDIKNAREEAGMQARNREYKKNRVKTFEESKVPPSFSQGQGQPVTRPKKKEGLFDDLQNYH